MFWQSYLHIKVVINSVNKISPLGRHPRAGGDPRGWHFGFCLLFGTVELRGTVN